MITILGGNLPSLKPSFHITLRCTEILQLKLPLKKVITHRFVGLQRPLHACKHQKTRVLFFHDVGPRDWNKFIEFGGKHLYLLS